MATLKVVDADLLDSNFTAIGNAIRAKSGKVDLMSIAQMPSEIMAIESGGTPLAFEIVGGTEEPANPTENLIWINTDAEITSWIIGVDEPEAPIEGMIWLMTGLYGATSFNALYENGIVIIPIKSKQYISGAWVNKTATSYQGGEWVEWMPEGALYWRGNECVPLTGGWVAKAWKLQADATTNGQTYEITRNADNMTFTKTGDIGAVMHTAYKINLTNADTIKFKGEMTAAAKSAWVGFFVWPNLSGTYWNTNAAAKVNGEANGIKNEFTLDVSALEGEYYLGFGIYDECNRIKVEELYMEVAE